MQGCAVPDRPRKKDARERENRLAGCVQRGGGTAAPARRQHALDDFPGHALFHQVHLGARISQRFLIGHGDLDNAGQRRIGAPAKPVFFVHEKCLSGCLLFCRAGPCCRGPCPALPASRRAHGSDAGMAAARQWCLLRGLARDRNRAGAARLWRGRAGGRLALPGRVAAARELPQRRRFDAADWRGCSIACAPARLRYADGTHRQRQQADRCTGRPATARRQAPARAPSINRCAGLRSDGCARSPGASSLRRSFSAEERWCRMASPGDADAWQAIYSWYRVVTLSLARWREWTCLKKCLPAPAFCGRGKRQAPASGHRSVAMSRAGLCPSEKSISATGRLRNRLLKAARGWIVYLALIG